MHPGPINRGVEISSDVVDSKNSLVLDQVENELLLEWQLCTYYLKKIVNDNFFYLLTAVVLIIILTSRLKFNPAISLLIASFF